MARKNDDYDWLDDPFDEKKAAAEREQAGSGKTGMALGIGCVVFVLIAAAAVIGGGMMLLGSIG
ncbi:hypothetical protein [Xiamenia xianingshaonis]|uniref:Uncharacterized protein n=1 Tax=Xiamenia xianingshaonis TaxID=2682776 RepID=A0A9E6MRH7_9ACTN|nr:hypothetical protein [Xiamenia xianingshaonis]NGM16722.1 hypothetical protein [Eggerthellaceae bacterium zg-893]NHM13726.1 hypothetical protein [Xiamenia xianingshaonis]NHM15654.1 hypothetical protein [Xiamenia xianingshaonis]QTU85094.1 hypothetical protein J7S26_04095 [Xiamenia xianingshaonis]